MRILLITVALAASAAASIHVPNAINRRPLLAPGWRRTSITRKQFNPASQKDIVAMAAKKTTADDKQTSSNSKPPGFLKWAYSACGLAMTGAWTTIVITTIRSNQPQGAMMPTWQHGFFARIGALSAVPLIGAAFATLASSASRAESWEDMGTPTCRRNNLALVTAGIGSALWTNFAGTITKIPGTTPLVSHQSYKGAMRAGLIGCYGSAAALGAAVWARSLPEDVRKNPLSWPGHIADGVSKSLVSLAPASRDDPVNVKYSLLASSFLIFTGLQLGSHPLSAIPSWTGRRLARAFPAWTVLGAASSFDLKEASENGTLFDSTHRTLSNGLRGFGATYLVARTGAVLLDPSFPESYHAIEMVPAWATAAILMIGMTLRSDKK